MSSIVTSSLSDVIAPLFDDIESLTGVPAPLTESPTPLTEIPTPLFGVPTPLTGIVAPLSENTISKLMSVADINPMLMRHVERHQIEGLTTDTNNKLVAIVCDFDHTIAFLAEHYRSMIEYGCVKPEIRNFLEQNPTMTGYHLVPAMKTLLQEWVNLYGVLVIITNKCPEFFQIIYNLMSELSISSSNYVVLSSKENSSYGLTLKLHMNGGLNGYNYVVMSNKMSNLNSFQETFRTKINRLTLCQTEFLMQVQ